MLRVSRKSLSGSISPSSRPRATASVRLRAPSLPPASKSLGRSGLRGNPGTPGLPRSSAQARSSTPTGRFARLDQGRASIPHHHARQPPRHRNDRGRSGLRRGSGVSRVPESLRVAGILRAKGPGIGHACARTRGWDQRGQRGRPGSVAARPSASRAWPGGRRSAARPPGRRAASRQNKPTGSRTGWVLRSPPRACLARVSHTSAPWCHRRLRRFHRHVHFRVMTAAGRPAYRFP